MASKSTSPYLDKTERILAELAENAKKEAEKNDGRAAENEKRAEENEKRAEENDRRVAENEKRAEENEKRAEENEKRAEENEKRAEENEKRAEENEKRTAKNERMIEELRESSRQVDRQLKRLGKQLGGESNRWGKIVENLVAGDLITIARDYLGVRISYVSTRARPEDRSWEIDVLGTNDDVVVVAEVKTTLTIEAIDKFLSSIMLPFTRLLPKHQRKKVYGIIAYVKVGLDKERAVFDYAWSKGLLVVKAMDGTNRVIEHENFTVHDYGNV